MSGNHDYPPPYHRPSRGSGSDERPYRPNNIAHLQHLRDLLSSEPNRDNYNTARALETLNQEIEEYRSDRVRDRTNFEQTRAAVDRQIQQLQSDLAGREDRIRRLVLGHERSRHPPVNSNPAPINQEATSSESAVSNSRSSRRRTWRPGERQTGRGNRASNSGASGMDTLQNPPRYPPFRSVRNSGSHHLLDDPIPHLESPSFMPQDLENDRELNRWRAKRRKLETDDNREGLRGFSYGQYGQVVPGALRMEIVSCDGGTYEPDGESSWPENVLRNDASVYCTKSDRCNLILRHRGETPFCLKKLVIKAPKSGFDAPIQEGMIFVSMTSDELLARTAQHQIQYSNSHRRRRNRRMGIPPSQEYLNAFRAPLQSLERTVLAGPDTQSDSENDLLPTTGPTSTNASGSVADFRVTTDYDDNSEANGNDDPEDDDEYPSVAELERIQIEQMEDDILCPESEESDSDDDATEITAMNPGRLAMRRRLAAVRHQDTLNDYLRRRRQIPSLIEPVASTTRGTPYSSGTHTHSPEVLKPHARFFIEREKSMVSIKFDPPPSGRFILIKLWSPHSGGNIDIQSIIAHGFAGPRFFPAGNFR